MLITKKIDLGEYIVEIKYDDETGTIEVGVLDELEEIIESITITNSEDDDSSSDFNVNLN
jgi:hypothetical protein